MTAIIYDLTITQKITTHIYSLFGNFRPQNTVLLLLQHAAQTCSQSFLIFNIRCRPKKQHPFYYNNFVYCICCCVCSDVGSADSIANSTELTQLRNVYV